MNNNAGPTLELDRDMDIKMEAEEDMAYSSETMWVLQAEYLTMSFVMSLSHSFIDFFLWFL